MRFKQLLIAVSVCAVTMAPAISHAEDVGPIHSWFQSVHENIQDFFEQFLPDSWNGSRNANDGPIFSAKSNGNSLNLNYNERAAQSVGDQFDKGFDQIGAAFSDIF